MSIRLRLTLWYVGILAATLIAFSVVLYFILLRNLSSEIDQTLQQRANQIHQAIGITSITLGDRTRDIINVPPANFFASPDIYVEILDGRGMVIESSANLVGQRLPVSADIVADGLSGHTILATLLAGGGERVRILSTPLVVNGRAEGLIQVGQSLHSRDLIMRRVRFFLGTGILGCLFVAAFTGWFLTHQSMRPIARVSRLARRISSADDLSQRIPFNGRRDEIGTLVETFNSMVERLDLAFRSQRQFVGDSSHELRTPLTVIRGNLDLLRRRLSEEDRAHCIQAIESETARMQKIVEDLLLLAQLDAHQPIARLPVELDVLMLETYQRAKALAGTRKLTLGEEDAVSVSGDPDKLRQLMLNLVDNAIKYSSEDAAVTLSLTREDGWAKFTVADTGMGIAPEDLPHVFDRFYRADKAHSRALGSTGLGLAIVKMIVDAHGGRIAVNSQVGVGTTFVVWLKLSPNSHLPFIPS